MNYLQLAQRLHQEIGGGPNDPGTDPDAVTSLSGELLRYASWIQSAWIDIQQERPDWRWMWAEGTQNTADGTREYTITIGSSVTFSGLDGGSTTTVTVTTSAAHSVAVGDTIYVTGFLGTAFNGTYPVLSTPTATTFTYQVATTVTTPLSNGTITLVRFGQAWPYSAYGRPCIRAYLTATGVTDSQPVWYREWRDFGGYLDAGNQTQEGRPTLFSIKPDGKLTLSPIPDATYTLVIPYRKKPQNLVLATDVPEMPAEYHMLIVWRALLYYGTSNESNRAAAQAELMYRRMMHRLKTEQIGAP